MKPTNFKCPRCKKEFKVGRLHASATCPKCGMTMLITRDAKMKGQFSKKSFQMYRG